MLDFGTVLTCVVFYVRIWNCSDLCGIFFVFHLINIASSFRVVRTIRVCQKLFVLKLCANKEYCFKIYLRCDCHNYIGLIAPIIYAGNHPFTIKAGGRRGRDRMVVVSATTYAISAYHH